MKLLIPFSMVFAGLMLAACGTKYQDMGFTGGVAAHQMSSDVYRIEARGNGYTGRNVVQDYMLLKAAETAKQAGHTHFAIVEKGDASETASIVLPGNAQTTFNGNTAYTTYTPASAIPVFKPGADAYIKVLSPKPGVATPANIFSADEIIKFVGSRVERG